MRRCSGQGRHLLLLLLCVVHLTAALTHTSRLLGARCKGSRASTRACAPMTTLAAARNPNPGAGRPPPPPLSNDPKDSFGDATFLGGCVLVGVGTGLAVALFKTSIAATVAFVYGGDSLVTIGSDRTNLSEISVLIPALGGIAVAVIRLLLPDGKLGPGLAEHVSEVELGTEPRATGSVARGAAAVATLGTGNALGPEGPSVELGIFISRLVGGRLPGVAPTDSAVDSDAVRTVAADLPDEGLSAMEDTNSLARAAQQDCRLALRRRRQLLAAGAAAGVAAGFNAPLAGVFFSLEVVSGAVRAAVPRERPTQLGSGPSILSQQESEQDWLSRKDAAELDVKSRAAIGGALVSALVAAAVIEDILGSDLALRPGYYAVRSPLVELPLYIGLGALSGLTALVFERCTETMRAAFRDAKDGDGQAGILSPVPVVLRPALGGLVCGLIGAAFPQILFFGYETLDAILATGTAANAGVAAMAGELTTSSSELSSLPNIDTQPRGIAEAMSAVLQGGVATREVLEQTGRADVLFADLLIAKLLATSICVGSGLVGGTFAPSLFLGAVLGIFYQDLAGQTLEWLAEVVAAYQTFLGVPVGSWGVIRQLTLADAPAYAMIGAAATLASVFRAPLTASLLVFELTLGYDIVLPLLAAAGTAPLVAESAKRYLTQVASAQPEGSSIDLSVDADAIEPFDISEECDVDNRIICEDESSSSRP